MGVIKLMDFIRSKCPQIINHTSALNYKNKTLAIDTPSTIYKFIIKTITSSSSKLNIPMDSQGNQTGHLIGIMYRALLCIEVGIKPIWVFDGTPPSEKLTELKRRKTLREMAQTKADDALQDGDLLEAVKQTKRSIKISKQQIKDTITMLKLMGMPTIKSFGQAQAQCSWLNKKLYADGVISQDLDNLAFGADLLIREFSRDQLAIQIPRQKLLNEIKMTQDQFIDFCILCGCDYTTKIKYIGPIKAYKMMKEEGSIEGVISKIVNDENLRKKHICPDYFNYLRARQLFKNPLVNENIKNEDLQQKQIDYEGLKQFLISKDFNQNRISKWIDVAKAGKRKWIQ